MFEKPPIQKESSIEESELPSEIQEFLSQEEETLKIVQASGSRKAKMMAAAFLAMSIFLGSTLPAMSAEKAPREKATSTSEIVGGKTASMIRAAQEQQKKEREEKEQKIVEELRNFPSDFLRGLENLTSRKQKVPTVLRERIVKEYIKDQYEKYKGLKGKIGQDNFYGSHERIMSTFLEEVAGSGKIENFLEQTSGKKNYFERSGEFLDDEDVKIFRNIKKGYDEKSK